MSEGPPTRHKLLLEAVSGQIIIITTIVIIIIVLVLVLIMYFSCVSGEYVHGALFAKVGKRNMFCVLP